MACVKSKGNKSTELKFIDILKARSISGWRRNQDVFGKPDFVFPKRKIAVFIDGCFWHGCPKHCRLPATNVQYWVNKIQGNVKRGKQVNNELKKKGWIVIRVWEHELKGGAVLSRKLNRIKKIISQGAKHQIVTSTPGQLPHDYCGETRSLRREDIYDDVR